jgi:hypothetical protein
MTKHNAHSQYWAGAPQADASSGSHQDAEASVYSSMGNGRMPHDDTPIPEGKHELVQRIQQETDSNKMIHLVQQLIDQIDSERVVKELHRAELPNNICP